jgi:probable HAF family extracellular repeat protein
MFATFLPAIYNLNSGAAETIPLLPDVGDGSWGEAYGVNDSGVVVGWNGDTNGYLVRAFRWQDGVLTDIENLLGGTDISADSIDNRGLIVGGADTPQGSRAFSYDINTGIMSELGIGGARGVNERGDAVGFIIVEFSQIHGILYHDGSPSIFTSTCLKIGGTQSLRPSTTTVGSPGTPTRS